ncbi:MAG: DUF3726 domain-containing protein [Rhodobacteraceae bacterium]|nr:DUF3726 domain-containing protein [Paracoccaceae bacterium]MCY4137744.1 DUF3726 domain-containing protein [Paracoccaceae bacterium]
MSRSLSEIEAMALKAARGAGHYWGVSEDAGRAVRWLCAAGIDGCAALAGLLSGNDPREPKKRDPGSPQVTAAAWNSPTGILCPLLTGMAISDHASSITAAGITLEQVARPVLLVPFAASAARLAHTGFCLEWQGASLFTDGYGLAHSQERRGLDVAFVKRVSVRRKRGTGCRPLRMRRFHPTDSDWAKLEELAARTYAPASDESRLLGAGAGLSDND